MNGGFTSQYESNVERVPMWWRHHDGFDAEPCRLTHWGRVTHICVGNLTSIGSDNGYWNSNIFIHDNALENICEIASIFSRPQCVNWDRPCPDRTVIFFANSFLCYIHLYFWKVRFRPNLETCKEDTCMRQHRHMEVAHLTSSKCSCLKCINLSYKILWQWLRRKAYHLLPRHIPQG